MGCDLWKARMVQGYIISSLLAGFRDASRIVDDMEDIVVGFKA
jgi:hypothetical protein